MITLFLQKCYLIPDGLWLGVIFSLFYGIRGFMMTENLKYSKVRLFVERIFQFIFNFTGSFVGWSLLYLFLVRVKAFSPVVSLMDLFLLGFAVVGIVGYLPQFINGVVLAIPSAIVGSIAKYLGIGKGK